MPRSAPASACITSIVCGATVLARSRQGLVPDLRAMTRPTHDIFDAIVLEGVLAPVGMIGFKDVLTPAESEMIRRVPHSDGAQAAGPRQ